MGLQKTKWGREREGQQKPRRSWTPKWQGAAEGGEAAFWKGHQPPTALKAELLRLEGHQQLEKVLRQGHKALPREPHRCLGGRAPSVVAGGAVPPSQRGEGGLHLLGGDDPDAHIQPGSILHTQCQGVTCMGSSACVRWLMQTESVAGGLDAPLLEHPAAFHGVVAQLHLLHPAWRAPPGCGNGVVDGVRGEDSELLLLRVGDGRDREGGVGGDRGVGVTALDLTRW